MNDRELIQKLNQIKDIKAGGSPDQDWATSNKDILMSQIRPNQTVETPVQKAEESSYYIQFFNNIFRQKILRPALATFIVVFMMLGYTATISMASASLPGDTLYPIKTVKEKFQMALTFSEEDKVLLQMNFVTRRTSELQKLAINDADIDDQLEQMEKTAKQISEDVKVVQDRLNKITLAAVDSDKEEVIEVAKEIDTKTLEVRQGIIEANESLSEEIKEGVADELKEAMDTTEDTGTSALIIIIEEYENGDTEIDNIEVASRVADRIKDAEVGIEGVIKAVDNVTTTTPALLLSTEMDNMVSTTTLETIEEIKDRPQEAQDIIDEAKDLLNSNEFGSALEKISETNNIVNVIEDEVSALSSEIINNVNSTTTGEVIIYTEAEIDALNSETDDINSDSGSESSD